MEFAGQIYQSEIDIEWYLREGKNRTEQYGSETGHAPEKYPHIGINGARLATENVSVLLFKHHYYKEYADCAMPNFKVREFELPVVDIDGTK